MVPKKSATDGAKVQGAHALSLEKIFDTYNFVLLMFLALALKAPTEMNSSRFPKVDFGTGV